MKVPSRTPSRSKFYRRSAAAFRWLHLYLSLLGFAALIFFAFTGITLNHPTWFGASEQVVRDAEGTLDPRILANEIDKLTIAETVREKHSLKGRVAEFEIDQWECMIVFKGPGYAADVFADRESGRYTITETSTGAMAVLNDLHKGRDSGAGWSWVIDISAVLLLLMSVTGFGLLFYLKKRLRNGLLTAFIGTAALIVVWAICVP